MTNGSLGFTSSSNLALSDRFDVIKEVGDGSFGSVVLAKVRSAGASVARRGSLVAIKTMKKTFDSFQPCLELREVIFLRTLPVHPHLVPALDIFLDPHTKKLHIAMEYMDGNLYQLMKAREGKLLEQSVVKSVLFQILSGLEHIHAHGFFHRDIKPENILVSTSAHSLNEAGSLRRYSAMVTPPSTPPVYTVKIADFGLARETTSKMPYTTYVSTRWYRAPEVLLRAGEYSAPVDIWAVGAMAVEVATLKPLFPGGNEVDQVWRVCEIMGSPGAWVGRSGKKMGGGEWREGTRLAGRLGFSFPRMAPVPMETILQTPTWPASLANFVTWCLMWDPRNRPTSGQALAHDYFRDAVDPLLPRTSTPSRLARKSGGDLVMKQSLDSMHDVHPTLEKKGSWFRKSFIGNRIDGVVSPPPTTNLEQHKTGRSDKRSTWHAPKAQTSTNQQNCAPMMILPSIKPVSPLSDAVSVQAAKIGCDEQHHKASSRIEEKVVKKIGRQLSIASTHSQNGHYNNSTQQTMDKLNGNIPGAMVSPSATKESFFSHLRKRARRLSGRATTGIPPSPEDDDVQSGVGCGMVWGGGREAGSNRSSMLVDTPNEMSIRDVDVALHESQGSNSNLRRNLSFPPTPNASRAGDPSFNSVVQSPVFPRTRRSVRNTKQRYETPDENDELLDEVLTGSNGYGSRRQSSNYETPARKASDKDLRNIYAPTGYPTPSPQANHRFYGGFKSPLDIGKGRRDDDLQPKWPTPPSEGDGGWGPIGYPTAAVGSRR